MDALVFILIIICAGVLFYRSILPLELCALAIVALLILSGIVPHKEAFSSFGNESVFLIGSLFVLTEGIKRTGLMQRGQDLLLHYSGNNRNVVFIILLLSVALLSAFVSNTATIAIAIPLAGTIARSLDESPGRWLLPLAYASVLGGMTTLIGTSTNIIISGLLPEYGYSSFNLFSLTPVTGLLLIPGLLYLIWPGPLFLGKKDAPSPSVDVQYDLGAYTTELLIEEDSQLCGASPQNTRFFNEADIVLLAVANKQSTFLPANPAMRFEAGDRLLVEGNIRKLSAIIHERGLRFYDERPSISSDKLRGILPHEDALDLHELLVTENSLLSGKTPAETFLRNRYKLSLLAVRRHNETIRSRLSQVVLQPGDILLVQFLGPINNEILDFMGLIPLQKIVRERNFIEKAPYVLGLIVVALFLGTATTINLASACLAAVVLMALLRIMPVDEMFNAIEWKILIFIGAVIVIGKGMELSGTAAILGDLLSSLFAGSPAVVVLTFFFLITTVMTSLLSNQATAVVMIPLAIQTAESLGINAWPFIYTVTVASSCCFMTPLEPAFLLVYRPGGYRPIDFIKMGLTLNIIAAVITITAVLYFWNGEITTAAGGF